MTGNKTCSDCKQEMNEEELQYAYYQAQRYGFSEDEWKAFTWICKSCKKKRTKLTGIKRCNMKIVPQEVNDVDMAFPAQVKKLMPKYEDIPEEYRELNNSNKWVRLFNDWFFFGLEELQLNAKEGIDEKKALRHISTIMRSFEPKHEHKEAACAYLLSLWFDDVRYKIKQKKTG